MNSDNYLHDTPANYSQVIHKIFTAKITFSSEIWQALKFLVFVNVSKAKYELMLQKCLPSPICSFIIKSLGLITWPQNVFSKSQNIGLDAIAVAVLNKIRYVAM